MGERCKRKRMVTMAGRTYSVVNECVSRSLEVKLENTRLGEGEGRRGLRGKDIFVEIDVMKLRICE